MSPLKYLNRVDTDMNGVDTAMNRVDTAINNSVIVAVSCSLISTLSQDIYSAEAEISYKLLGHCSKNVSHMHQKHLTREK